METVKPGFFDMIFVSETGTLDKMKETFSSGLEIISNNVQFVLDNLLITSCTSGNKDISEWLINEKGVLVTPLVVYKTCQSGNIQLLKLIISKLKSDCKLKFSDIFSYALISKKTILARWLWKNRNHFNEKLDLNNQIASAGIYCDPDLIKWFASIGAQINEKVITDITKKIGNSRPDSTNTLLDVLNGNMPDPIDDEIDPKIFNNELRQMLVVLTK